MRAYAVSDSLHLLALCSGEDVGVWEALGARQLARLKHPHPDVDDTPYAYYFQQATNGVYARQAILSLILNEEV